jgi:hypothetical protein
MSFAHLQQQQQSVVMEYQQIESQQQSVTRKLEKFDDRLDKVCEHQGLAESTLNKIEGYLASDQQQKNATQKMQDQYNHDSMVI